MTIIVNPVSQITDTFGQWLSKTNQVILAVNTYAVTVNSNTAVGNAAITGKLTANAFVTSNTGALVLGTFTSNTVVNSTTLTMKTSLTTNLVMTGSGLLINGGTQYSATIMSLGNTTVRGSNISTNNIYLTTFANVGNTFLTRTSMYADNVNTHNLSVSANSTFGDNQANTYLSRYGVIVYSQPTGTYIVNTNITSTSISTVDVYANNLHGNLVGPPGKPIIFNGNTDFKGANNYFDFGLNSNGDINLINGARLHVILGTPIGAEPINGKAGIIIDNNDNSVIQFRNSSDTGQYAGLAFSDNNMGGYLVYNSPGGTSGANGDIMSFGAYNGFKFGIGTQDSYTGVGLKSQIAASIDTHGIEISGVNGAPALRIRDVSAGDISFYDTKDPDAGVYNYTLRMDGGQIGFYFSPTNSPYDIGSVQFYSDKNGDTKVFNSLGVGITPTGVAGQIKATTIISTGVMTAGGGINVTGAVAATGAITAGSDITAGGSVVASNQIRAGQDIISFTSSDRTLKTNIVNIGDALNKVTQINGVTFDWTDEFIAKQGGEDGFFIKKHDVGVIAQEVEAILPEIVATRADGTKAVKYEKIVALLIEAVKELKAEVDSLKNVSTK